MNAVIATILGIVTSVVGYLGYQDYTEQDNLAVGGFSDPFLSIQLAENPQNGYILQTDGTDNSWVVNSGGGGGGAGLWEYDSATDTLSPIVASTSNTAIVTGSSFNATSTATSSTFAGGFVSQASSTFTGATTTFTQDISLLGNLLLDSDGDSYLTSEQDDEITFYIGGSESEVFNGSQVVFNEDGGDRDFRVEASGEANAFFVQGSDGNVGLGTNNPQSRIEALGASAADPSADWFSDATFGISFLDDQTQTAQLTAFAGATGTQRPLAFGRRSRGTLDSPSAVQDGDWLYSLIASGHDGTSFEQGASVNFEVDGSVSTGNIPTALTFETGDNFSDRTERMRIDPDGNIQFNAYTTEGFITNDTSGNLTSSTTISESFVDSLIARDSELYTDGDVSSYLYGSTTRSDLYTAGTGLSWSGNTLNAEVQSSDLHDAVTLTGTPDYITLSGQQITRNQIDLTADVTNRLPFANFNTGTARSVVGRAGSGNGNVGNITAGNNTILSRSGSGNVAFNSASTSRSLLNVEDGAAADQSLDEAYNTGSSITADGGAVAITVPNTSDNAGLTITQNDTTNNPNPLVIANAGTGYDLYLTNSRDGNAGSGFLQYHDSASPADDDLVVGNDFAGNDSNGNLTNYAGIRSYILDQTDSSERGYITLEVGSVGTLFPVLYGGYSLGNDAYMDGISVGSGFSSGILESTGSQNLVLRSGNSTTGNITITDGANGNITIAADGTGDIVFSNAARLLAGSNPSIGDAGDLVFDTTTNQTVISDGTNDHVLLDSIDRSLGSIGSTSRDRTLTSFDTGTSTWSAGHVSATTSVTDIFAQTDTGTCNVRVGDGTNWSSSVVADSDGQGLSVSETFNYTDINTREEILIEIGGCASSPNWVTPTFTQSEVRQ